MHDWCSDHNVSNPFADAALAYCTSILWCRLQGRCCPKPKLEMLHAAQGRHRARERAEAGAEDDHAKTWHRRRASMSRTYAVTNPLLIV